MLFFLKVSWTHLLFPIRVWALALVVSCLCSGSPLSAYSLCLPITGVRDVFPKHCLGINQILQDWKTFLYCPWSPNACIRYYYFGLLFHVVSCCPLSMVSRHTGSQIHGSHSLTGAPVLLDLSARYTSLPSHSPLVSKLFPTPLSLHKTQVLSVVSLDFGSDYVLLRSSFDCPAVHAMHTPDQGFLAEPFTSLPAHASSFPTQSSNWWDYSQLPEHSITLIIFYFSFINGQNIPFLLRSMQIPSPLRYLSIPHYNWPHNP